MYKDFHVYKGRMLRTLPDGVEEVSFYVKASELLIYRLANRAAKNKGGKATAGPLTVYVTGRTKTLSN